MTERSSVPIPKDGEVPPGGVVSGGWRRWWRGPRCTGTGEKPPAGWEPPRFGARRSACHPALPLLGYLAPPRAPPWPWGRVGGGNWEEGGEEWLRSPRLFPSSTSSSPPYSNSETSLLAPFTSPRRTALVTSSSALLVHFPSPPESGVLALGLRGSGACELSIKCRSSGYLLML